MPITDSNVLSVNYNPDGTRNVRYRDGSSARFNEAGETITMTNARGVTYPLSLNETQNTASPSQYEVRNFYSIGVDETSSASSRPDGVYRLRPPNTSVRSSNSRRRDQDTALERNLTRLQAIQAERQQRLRSGFHESSDPYIQRLTTNIINEINEMTAPEESSEGDATNERAN